METTPPFQQKISSKASLFSLCFILTIIIYITEELGKLVGLQGLSLNISPVWPAAGIALAALLLYGWQVWPGIFLGFLIYNAIHLTSHDPILIRGIASSLVVSSGSLLQAFVGAFIIRRYASIDFYNKLNHTLFFLIPGGLITCLIAASITVSFLFLIGQITAKNFASAWVTFWLGDTFGVYLATPFILGFALSKPIEYTWQCRLEILLLFTLLLGTLIGIFFDYFPLPYLILPFLLWATFRFNIRGATSSLLLSAAIAILATSMDHGPFATYIPGQPLSFLVSFIGVITATILIVTSVLNERIENARLIQEYNTNLEQTVNIRTRQLQEAQEEIAVKEKLSSLGILAAGISYEIKNPLNYVHDLAKTAEDYVQNLKIAYEQNLPNIPSSFAELLHNNYGVIKECLQKISEYNKQAQEIVEVMVQHSRRDSESKEIFKPVNLHNILNSCCSKAIRDFEAKTPFVLKVIKEYDPAGSMIDAMPFDLSRAFTNVFDNAVYALKQKAEQGVEMFEPTLTIATQRQNNHMRISIKDNGIGMPDAVLRRVFQPFFSTKPPGEGTGLGMALSHAIIVQEHHGNITISSQKGTFTEITVTLPVNHRIYS